MAGNSRPMGIFSYTRGKNSHPYPLLTCSWKLSLDAGFFQDYA